MIKPILLSFLLVSLISCSHTNKGVRVQSNQADAFSQESFWRYDQTRLSSIPKSDQLEQGERLCYEKKIEEGINHITKQSAQYDKTPAYWNHLSHCYYLANDYAKSSFALDMGLAQKANNRELAPLFNNKAILLHRNRHFDQAKVNYELAIKNAPGTLTPQYNLAQLYLQFSHFEKAGSILKVLNQRYPNDLEIRAHLGIVYLGLGQNKLALQVFNSLDEKHSRRSDMAAYIAIAHIENQNPEEAKKVLLRQASTRDPKIRSMTLMAQKRIDFLMEEQRKLAEEQKRLPAEVQK